MRIVIEYYPDAEDNLDVGATDPSWSESAGSFENACDSLARLGRHIDRTTESKNLTTEDL